MRNARCKGAVGVSTGPRSRLLGTVCDRCEQEIKPGDEVVDVVKHGSIRVIGLRWGRRRRLLSRFCKRCAREIAITTAIRGGRNRLTFGIADPEALCYLPELQQELLRRAPFGHAEIEWAGEQTLLVTLHYFEKRTQAVYTYDVRTRLFTPVSGCSRAVKPKD